LELVNDRRSFSLRVLLFLAITVLYLSGSESLRYVLGFIVYISEILKWVGVLVLDLPAGLRDDGSSFEDDHSDH
jgi:hypothetical protein